MKHILIALVTGILLLMLAACQTNRPQPVEKEDKVIGIGSINGTRVSACGKPTISSQLVFQFNKGEQVKILEKIAVANPKAGEPREWLRVQVPSDCGLWVDARYLGVIIGTVNLKSRVHRTETLQANVEAQQLEVLGGAGENFPVLGILKHGDTVHLSGQTKNHWAEIYAPKSTSIYVPAYFITLNPNRVGKVRKNN